MDIHSVVEQQREYFNTGATKPVKFRLQALENLKKIILMHKSEIEAALKADLNKSAQEAYMTEIGLTINEITYVMKHLKHWTKAKRLHTPLTQFHAKSFILPEPYGVILVMSPWNYPFLLSLEPLIGAIAAGNCCILKPSNYSPATSGILKTIVEEAFAPEQVAIVTGGRKENEGILEERFDYIFFTGGVTVGKMVMEKAAKNLTPITLELGGKSPCIVDRSANIKLAAKRLAFGKFINAGQTCVAPDYLMVHSSVKNELIRYIKEYIIEFFGNDPIKNKDYPRIVNIKHFQRICRLFENEDIIMGGTSDIETLKIAPTLLDNINGNKSVMQEEIFGPVLPIMAFESISEAENYVLNREKPLALYLFTSDKVIEERILKNLSFGGGCINDTIMHLASPYMSFGGVGSSGMGSYHGKYSFNTFSHHKSILKRYNWIDIPLRYHPYTELKSKLIRLLLK